MKRGGQERWATKIGVVLAVAGSAIGLGNFLRFPTQAAQYGGGAFMIPYFCAVILLGLPLMWLEWGLGRCGGNLGRHSLPGIYHVVTGRRWAKYLGVLGIYVPFVMVVYYTYIESWTLGYGFHSLAGSFTGLTGEELAGFLGIYLGIGERTLSIPTWGLLFLGITLLLNFWVVYHGVSRGIERLSKVAMPLLFVMALVLVVRVLTLRNVGVASPAEGLEFLWKPDFSKLGNAQVWLAAAGQVFFTLSLGLGAIITYGSYLRRNDDVALSGLTSASLNEFAEVVLGASIAVPAAVIFFGASQTMAIAEGGSVQLGFKTLPIVFQQLPLGNIFGLIWFLLLFFAGVTSSVSLLQPLVAFFQDEFGWNRHKSTLTLLAMTSACLVPLVLLMKFGFLDEIDFWTCNVLLPLGALIEVLMFIGLVGMKRGWEEITRGAGIRVPVIFRYILTYITPVYLAVLLAFWMWQQALPKLLLAGVDAAARPYVLAARALMVVLLIAMVVKVRVAWSRQHSGKVTPPGPEAEGDAGLEEQT